MTTAIPRPPATLSAEAKRMWREILAEFAVTDIAGLVTLRTALEAHDQMRAAQAEIKRDGLTILDRYGCKKAHPASDVAVRCRGQWLAALKQLGLDSGGVEK